MSPAPPATGRDGIVCALRASWDPLALPSLAAAATADKVDWEALLAEGGRESVLPLLWWILRGQPWLPPTAASQLRRAYIETAARNTLVLDELAAVLEGLTAAGLPIIVLKGAALAEAVYGNPALRPMADIDLLVPRDKALAAVECLLRSGYVPVRPELAPERALEFENSYNLVRPGPLALPVELHWSLLDVPHYQWQLPMDWFWSTSELATIAGRPARSLGVSGQLIHLCAHLALHHGGSGLLWHHDIAAFTVRRSELVDWADLVACASAWDLVLPLRGVLGRVAADWQAPVPPETLAALALAPVTARAAAISRQRQELDRSASERLLEDFAGLPDWPTRLRFAITQVVPGPNYMRERYDLRHPALLVLAYPYRWWRGMLGIVRRG